MRRGDWKRHAWIFAAIVCVGVSLPYLWFAWLGLRDNAAPFWLILTVIMAGVGWLVAAVLLFLRSNWRTHR